MGISEATVSLALNNSSLVKDSTREKVIKIAKEMGYTPNLIARSLATKKSYSIGMIIPDINIIFYANVLREMDKIVNEQGYSLVMAMSNNDAKIEEQCIRSFVSKRIDGVFAVPTNKSTKHLKTYRNMLEKYKIPVIFITSLYVIDNIKYVLGDIETGTYDLVQYLISLGHREIVFMGGHESVPTTFLRLNGYKRAMEESGLEIKKENIIECDDIHYQDALQATKKLISERKDFTAICAMNDEMASGVLNILLNAGMKVPEDVSLVGYDNTILSQVALAGAGITTMDANIRLTCEKASAMMISIMNNEPVEEEHVYIKPTMIQRKSTGPVAIR